MTEGERHAIGHAKYLVERATPESPEVCFDYELVATLLTLIERLQEAWYGRCVIIEERDAEVERLRARNADLEEQLLTALGERVSGERKI